MKQGLFINQRINFRSGYGLAVISGILLCLAYPLWILTPFYSSALDAVFASLGVMVLSAFASIMALLLIRNNDLDLRLRTGWFIIALAIACNLAGESLWFYYESVLGIDPFPSLADAFYLSYYPLLLVGLLLFPSAPTSTRQRLSYWIDQGIVFLSCVILFWYFILYPVFTAETQSWGALVAVAYPVGDLMLLFGVGLLIHRDIEKVNSLSLLLLGLGLLATAVADTVFTYNEVMGSAYSIRFLNFLWMVSVFFDITAVYAQSQTRSSFTTSLERKLSQPRHFLRMSMPYLAVAIGLGLVVEIINTNSSINLQLRGLLIGGLVLLGLVFLRQFIVLKENFELYEEMRYMACTDSLTGLYNRHFFNEMFLSVFQRARRYNLPLSVLLIDVDGFKKINDSLGHLQGDRILKTVGEALAEELRASDLIARFGGDEFVILMPETTLESAKMAANRIKQAVAAVSEKQIPLSVSIGVADYQPGLSPEGLLEQADQSLYVEKGSHSTQLAIGKLP